MLKRGKEKFKFCTWPITKIQQELCDIDFSVAFHLTTDVHKSDSRLVIDWPPNIWRPVQSDRDLCFSQNPVWFLRKLRRRYETPPPTHVVKAKALLVSKHQLNNTKQAFVLLTLRVYVRTFNKGLFRSLSYLTLLMIHTFYFCTHSLRLTVYIWPLVSQYL